MRQEPFHTMNHLPGLDIKDLNTFVLSAIYHSIIIHYQVYGIYLSKKIVKR